MEHSSTDKKEGSETEDRVYNWKDLLKYENKQIYTSIGRMVLSNRRSKPRYGFGTSTRKQA